MSEFSWSGGGRPARPRRLKKTTRRLNLAWSGAPKPRRRGMVTGISMNSTTEAPDDVKEGAKRVSEEDEG